MDESRFDGLARAFAALRTRRKALLLLGGAIAVPGVVPDDTAAKPKKRKKPCKAPKKKCGGKCIAVQSDDANCGACGNRCSRGQICRAGQCKALVPPVDCPIGQCCQDNQACDGDGRCRGGQCQPRPNCLSAGDTLPLFGETPPCCSDDAECAINEQGGMRCICKPSEPSEPCLRNSDCRSGNCLGYQCIGCPAETFLCEGACMTFNSEAHCGACGNACDRDEFCQEQTCQPRYQQDASWGGTKGLAAVFVDDTHTVFTASDYDHCVMQRAESGALETTYGLCANHGQDNRHLYGPQGVVAYGELVFIADANNHRIQIFARMGAWVATLASGPGSGTNQLNTPNELALDKDNNLYVVDQHNHRVQKFNKSGTYVRSFGTGVPGAGENQLNQPAGVAVDRHGYVYVADTGNHRVQQFDSQGQFIKTFGSYGTGPGQFNTPTSCAVTTTGDVFVVDVFNNRVQQLAPNGNVIRIFSAAPLRLPSAVAVDGQNNLYIADELARQVFRYRLIAPTSS